jgi:hypothetical protein
MAYIALNQRRRQPKNIINALDMSNNVESANPQTAHAVASSKPLDYYSILTEAIHNTEQNSAQLRALVYERARFHLKREILFGHSSLGLADLVRQINDLELAIARIETTAVDRQPIPSYRQFVPVETPEPAPAPSGNAVQVLAPTPVSPVYADISPMPNADYFGRGNADYFGTNHGWEAVARHIRSATRFVGFVLLGFLFTGLVLMGSALWYFPMNSTRVETASKVNEPTAKISERATPPANSSNDNSVASADSSPAVEPSPKIQFPLPTSFGIYVLHDNKLSVMETLPISVPDPRVAISAEIKKPSELEISDATPAFILFRRDLLNSAPQKVALRVVARMVRETKIINGKPKVSDSEDSWRIRNISRELNVSPIPGNPEMVIARVDENAPLAAGRYALVLNRVAYDFTISGPVTSLDFCLEGFETADGAIYTPCRAP